VRDQIKERYEIIGELGAGGMATVYKAVQKSLDRPVAIKELKQIYQGDKGLIERFEREAKVAASLQHENICHVYDFWSAPDPCIVMEYVDGVGIDEIIDGIGALPVDVAVMIAAQVCGALGFAHGRGVIHRDIKPSNIMITRGGEVKLMDFGVAYARALPALTQPGVSMGTPAYMAPEQIQGRQADARSDVFAMGIVLYEMLTGTNPFEGAEQDTVTAKIVAGQYVPPRRLNRDVPLLLQRVIRKCLRKNPARRYGSAQDLEKALGRRLRGRTNQVFSRNRIADYLNRAKAFGNEATPGEESTIAAVPVSGRYVRTLAAGAAAVALLTAGAGYFFWVKRDERPPRAPAAASEPLSGLTTTQTPTAPPPN
jgi:serine/threonine-protein kinase